MIAKLAVVIGSYIPQSMVGQVSLPLALSSSASSSSSSLIQLPPLVNPAHLIAVGLLIHQMPWIEETLNMTVNQITDYIGKILLPPRRRFDEE